MKAGFEGATLRESLKMHPRVLVYPSRKKYGGNLQAIEEAASRQFHPVYAKLVCAYLGDDDLANIHVYVVDIVKLRRLRAFIPSQDLICILPTRSSALR